MIDGVEVKKLVTHADERGFFRQIVRNTREIVVKERSKNGLSADRCVTGGARGARSLADIHSLPEHLMSTPV